MVSHLYHSKCAIPRSICWSIGPSVDPLISWSLAQGELNVSQQSQSEWLGNKISAARPSAHQSNQPKNKLTNRLTNQPTNQPTKQQANGPTSQLTCQLTYDSEWLDME